MRPNTYDDTKAYCLCKVLVLPDEITCFSQDVQLQSACSDKFLSIQNDRIFANQNTDNPQIFTIQGTHLPHNNSMEMDIRLTFYVKDRGYICFNQKWQPRLMKKHKNVHNEHSCVFRERMDRGYFTFSSVKDPQKFLGFMRNGRPINYSNLKHDEKCRLIYKKEIYRDSSNDVTSSTSVSSPIYQETSMTPPPTHQQRKSNKKTHSNKVDSTKPPRNNKNRTHHVRHHHDNLGLRHSHQHKNNLNNLNIINNNNNDNLSNVNLVKDRINYNSNNDHDPYNNSVVNISDNNAVDDVKVKNTKRNDKKINRKNKKNNERTTRKKPPHKQSANQTPEN